MLDEALAARLPVITVTSPDGAMVEQTLSGWAAKSDMGVALFGSNSLGIQSHPNTVFYLVEATASVAGYIPELQQANSVLVLVNPQHDAPYSYHAGPLLPTPEQLEKAVRNKFSKASLSKVLPCFHGLTLLQVSTVMRLAWVRYKDMGVSSLLRTRTELYGKAPGLTMVSSDSGFYQPHPMLLDWLKENRPFFVGNVHPDLIPRGLMLDGLPGTGKSEAAKWLARELGVPLLKLELATGLGKYVGESEANLMRALQIVQTESPCVFLMDEVEKLFMVGNNDAGVTGRMLSQLLWWLQEHRSRVLTVMTTNNRREIPPELFRPGRIDKVMTFGPLGTTEAKALALSYLSYLGQKELGSAVVEAVKNLTEATPVAVVNAVKMCVKANTNPKEAQS